MFTGAAAGLTTAAAGITFGIAGLAGSALGFTAVVVGITAAGGFAVIVVVGFEDVGSTGLESVFG